MVRIATIYLCVVQKDKKWLPFIFRAYNSLTGIRNQSVELRVFRRLHARNNISYGRKKPIRQIYFAMCGLQTHC